MKEPSDSKESKPLDPQDNNTEEATGPEQKGVGMTDKTEAKKSKGNKEDFCNACFQVLAILFQ